jgi:hypothetical protein
MTTETRTTEAWARSIVPAQMPPSLHSLYPCNSCIYARKTISRSRTGRSPPADPFSVVPWGIALLSRPRLAAKITNLQLLETSPDACPCGESGPRSEQKTCRFRLSLPAATTWLLLASVWPFWPAEPSPRSRPTLWWDVNVWSGVVGIAPWQHQRDTPIAPTGNRRNSLIWEFTGRVEDPVVRT